MAFFFTSTTKVVKDLIILLALSTWEWWYKESINVMPNQFWKYFDLDGDAEATKPITPIKLVDNLPLLDAKAPQLQR